MKNSNNIQTSLMQQALGKQWEKLPQALKLHYNNNEEGENIAKGVMTIDYPRYMQLPLYVMRILGALLNRKGVNIPTTVKRVMREGEQYWHRTIFYPGGDTVSFKSRFTYDIETHTFIEYTNRFLGLKMRAFVEGNELRYESCGYLIRLGNLKVALPEWLALGHASIIEVAITDSQFKMNFQLIHPIFGRIFSYTGIFQTL